MCDVSRKASLFPFDIFCKRLSFLSVGQLTFIHIWCHMHMFCLHLQNVFYKEVVVRSWSCYNFFIGQYGLDSLEHNLVLHLHADQIYVIDDVRRLQETYQVAVAYFSVFHYRNLFFTIIL